MKIEVDELLYEQLEEAVQAGLSKEEICNIYLNNKLFVGSKKENVDYVEEVYNTVIKFIKEVDYV